PDQQLFKFFQQEFAAFIDGSNTKLRTLFFAQHLPWNDIGVVLHASNQDFVPASDMFTSICLRDQVDSLSGSAKENDFLCVRCIDERLRRYPRLLVRFRCTLGKSMHPAMNVRIVVAVVALNGVDHCEWLLSCRRVIEINQRLAVHLLMKNGKILAHLLNVISARLIDLARSLGYGTHPTSSQFLSTFAGRPPA